MQQNYSVVASHLHSSLSVCVWAAEISGPSDRIRWWGLFMHSQNTDRPNSRKRTLISESVGDPRVWRGWGGTSCAWRRTTSWFQDGKWRKLARELDTQGHAANVGGFFQMGYRANSDGLRHPQSLRRDSCRQVPMACTSFSSCGSTRTLRAPTTFTTPGEIDTRLFTKRGKDQIGFTNIDPSPRDSFSKSRGCPYDNDLA